MSDVDPGPFAPLARDQFAPLPDRPSFQAIVAGALEALPGLDARGAGASNDLVAAGGDPSDGFDSELAAAVDDNLEAPGAGSESEAADTIGRGDSLDGLRQSVSDQLPSPDSPVTFDYSEPPPPPDTAAAQRAEEKNPPSGEVLDQ